MTVLRFGTTGTIETSMNSSAFYVKKLLILFVFYKFNETLFYMGTSLHFSSLKCIVRSRQTQYMFAQRLPGKKKKLHFFDCGLKRLYNNTQAEIGPMAKIKNKLRMNH